MKSYFSVEEFYVKQMDIFYDMRKADADPISYISPVLIKSLNELREMIDAPIITNSVFRSYAHNISVGGGKYSRHLFGLAADIYSPTVDISDLYDCAKSISAFKGFGVANTYLHLDVRGSKERSFWNYA